MPSLLPLIQAGKLRPLAAASAARNPIVADVPTFERARHQGHGDLAVVRARAARPALPQPIVQRLNTELAKILKSDEVRENFAKQGAFADARLAGGLRRVHAR